MPTAAQYRRLKDAGFCPACWQRPAPRGRHYCEDCLAARTADRAVRRRVGLCITCCTDALPGRRLCARCQARETARVVARKRKLESEGRCSYCGDPLPEGYDLKTCETCRPKLAERRRERRSARRMRLAETRHMG